MTSCEPSRYSITAYWGPRREDPQALTTRLLATLKALEKVDPAFGNWYFLGLEKGTFMAPLSRDEIVALVAAGVDTADDGEPTPQSGYWFGALTNLMRVPRSVDVSVRAGNTDKNGDYFINTASITTEPLDEENATFITADVMKGALLALVSAWDVTWCGAKPWNIFDLDPPPRPGAPREHFYLAWMTYLSPRFAPLVTPPRSALVERTDNGGLLMMATEERFTIANPRHVAVAREIATAIAPVNALPWPPDATPE